MSAVTNSGQTALSRLQDEFRARFHTPAQVMAQAPGRLEILGNHTDYNEGIVLSCAVDQRTTVLLAKNGTRKARFYDLRDRSEGVLDLDDLRNYSPSWLGYPAGVLAELGKRKQEVPGFDVLLSSTVPLSAGMSSSAALEIALLRGLMELFHLEFSPNEQAYIGQGVENNFLGLKSGLLDQFSSVYGSQDALLLSDFRTVEVVKSLPMVPDCAILVVNSMAKHDLVNSPYNARRQACENAVRKLQKVYPGIRALRDVSTAMLQEAQMLLTDEEFRRALHVTGECERVIQAVDTLEQRDAKRFGQLWYESHESSRINFENSTPELDALIELSHEIPGALGARLSGGGFGGISIHLVRNAALESYQAQLKEAYKARCGISTECIVCYPGSGATSQTL